LKPNQDCYRLPIEHLPDAFAYHQIISDDHGNPVDYIFLEINNNFEDMTGLKRKVILGKKVTEILPAIKTAQFDWIGTYGQVALSGKANRFESFSEPLGRWYDVSAYSDQPGYFVTVFRNINKSKTTEQALIKSEEKHRHLFETMAQGVIYQDKEGKIISANPAAEIILGLSFDQIQGKTSMDPRWQMIKEDGTPVTGNDHPAMIALRTGKSVGPVIRGIYRPDLNNHIWLNITATPLFQSGEKNPFQAYATFVDITERKLMEEHMWQYQNIVSSTSDGIAFLDKDYRYIIVNDAYEKFSGIKREHFIGRTVAEYLGKDVFKQLIKPHFDKCLQGDTVIYQEWFEYPSLGRRFVEITYSPYRDVLDNISGVLSNTRDITERKIAEDKLQRVSFSVANLPDSIFWVGETGYFTDVNAAACRKLGYTREELLTMCVADIDPNFPPEQWAPHWEEMRQCGLKVIETIHRTKEGEMIPMELVIHNQLFGDTQYNIVLGRDITDRKKAENEIHSLNEELEVRVRERTAQLEASNRELDAFSYSVSHDLRGPLNRIKGFSQALLEDYSEQLDQQGQDYLRRIGNSSLHMAELIDDLLKLSKVSRMEIYHEPIELSALVNVCLKELQAREPQRNIEISVTPGLVVEGDTALLRIVLENLIDNACKFTRQEEVAQIEFGQTDQANQSAYYIRDNGAGFDMKHAAKLFTAFQRLHSDQEFSGTGIGLSIVSRIIHRHGGEVWAEGEPCKGACFYFTLP
jgi:PAS domain S-box-containing protein